MCSPLSDTADRRTVSRSPRRRGDETRVPLGRALVREGLCTEADILRALSMQLGLPAIDLDRERLDPKLTRLVPKRIAQKYRVVPLRLEKGERVVLHIAIPAPASLEALDAVRAVSGKPRVEPHLASDTALGHALAALYGIQIVLADWFAGGTGKQILALGALVGVGMAVYFGIAWVIGGIDNYVDTYDRIAGFLRVLPEGQTAALVLTTLDRARATKPYGYLLKPLQEAATPNGDDRVPALEAWRMIRGRLSGTEASTVPVTFEDGTGATVTRAITRMTEQGQSVKVGNLPAMYVRVTNESRTTPAAHGCGRTTEDPRASAIPPQTVSGWMMMAGVVKSQSASTT